MKVSIQFQPGSRNLGLKQIRGVQVLHRGLDRLAAMLPLLRWGSLLTGMFPSSTTLGVTSDQHCVVIGDHLLEDGGFYFCGFLGSYNACLLFLLIRC